MEDASVSPSWSFIRSPCYDVQPLVVQKVSRAQLTFLTDVGEDSLELVCDCDELFKRQFRPALRQLHQEAACLSFASHGGRARTHSYCLVAGACSERQRPESLQHSKICQHIAQEVC